MNLFMPLEQDAAEVCNNPAARLISSFFFFPNLLDWMFGSVCDGYSELPESSVNSLCFRKSLVSSERTLATTGSIIKRSCSRHDWGQTCKMMENSKVDNMKFNINMSDSNSLRHQGGKEKHLRGS